MYESKRAFTCICGCSDEGSEIPRGGEREMRLPGLFYADDMVLCCESEEDPEGDGGMFCGGV